MRAGVRSGGLAALTFAVALTLAGCHAKTVKPTGQMDDPPADPTRSITMEECSEGGGAWENFPNTGAYCHDECDKPERVMCGRAPSWHCDCGRGHCWDGWRCVEDRDDPDPTRDITRKDCSAGGGSWETFPGSGNYCHDECDKPDSVMCLDYESGHCECGRGQCWNGWRCVPDPTEKPLKQR